jgi:hypothetical protein
MSPAATLAQTNRDSLDQEQAGWVQWMGGSGQEQDRLAIIKISEKKTYAFLGKLTLPSGPRSDLSSWINSGTWAWTRTWTWTRAWARSGLSWGWGFLLQFLPARRALVHRTPCRLGRRWLIWGHGLVRRRTVGRGRSPRSTRGRSPFICIELEGRIHQGLGPTHQSGSNSPPGPNFDFMQSI